ncbi:hypothetical protein JB92DRAFT_3124862 [Gautieria morchelliformis]|nr:hypothetical protein JB92DRAFT_3124862 [Gautieria morchelliformis]
MSQMWKKYVLIYYVPTMITHFPDTLEFTKLSRTFKPNTTGLTYVTLSLNMCLHVHPVSKPKQNKPPTELPPISELLDLQHRLADQLVSLRDQIWRQDCQLQEFHEQLHPEPLHHPQPIMPPHIPDLQSNPTDECQPPLHFYGAFAPPPTIAVQPSVPHHPYHVFLPPAPPSSHHTPPFSPPGPPGRPPGPPGGPHFGGWPHGPPYGGPPPHGPLHGDTNPYPYGYPYGYPVYLPASGGGGSSKPKPCNPDDFTGEDSSKVKAFIASCIMAFDSSPNDFMDDQRKVNYAATYLTKVAGQWWIPQMTQIPEPPI